MTTTPKTPKLRCHGSFAPFEWFLYLPLVPVSLTDSLPLNNFRRNGDFWNSSDSQTLPEAQRTQKLTPWLGLNLATTWHQLAPLVLVAYLAITWHNLNWFKSWSSGCTTCIVCKVGHQVVSLALPHCLGIPYWYYQLVSSWYPHQPESHQLSLNKVCYIYAWRTSGPKDRTPGLPGSDKNTAQLAQFWLICPLLLPWKRSEALFKVTHIKLSTVAPCTGFL